MYEVGFKDVYPWVWSVMLGVAITLAERRGAFLPGGTKTPTEYWLKNLSAITINLGIPCVLFGLTMVRLGPEYSRNMDFWQVIGSLYLAGTPLGCQHLWLTIANRIGWLPDDTLNDGERVSRQRASYSFVVWAIVAVVIPSIAIVCKWRIPW